MNGASSLLGKRVMGYFSRQRVPETVLNFRIQAAFLDEAGIREP
jgi:hypothetical protein